MPIGAGRRGGGGRGGRGRHGRGGPGRAAGRERMGMGSAAAPGHCVCPRCSTVLPHRPGVPCFQTACPSCGSPMTRQFNVPGDKESPGQGDVRSPKPVVVRDACTGCQECVTVCPEAAIEMRDDKAFILSGQCTNCRVCIPACPENAIK